MRSSRSARSRAYSSRSSVVHPWMSARAAFTWGWTTSFTISGRRAAMAARSWRPDGVGHHVGEPVLEEGLDALERHLTHLLGHRIAHHDGQPVAQGVLDGLEASGLVAQGGGTPLQLGERRRELRHPAPTQLGEHGPLLGDAGGEGVDLAPQGLELVPHPHQHLTAGVTRAGSARAGLRVAHRHDPIPLDVR